jgi:chromosome segregation ATPase
VDEQSLAKGLASFGEDLARSLVNVNASRCLSLTEVLRAASQATGLLLDTPDCNKQRSDLQKQFTDAFTELTDLYDRTIKEIVDEYEACKMHADLIYNDADEEITKEISDATAAIATAKKAIEGMEPHLSDANSAVETLRNHIENLEKTCAIDSDVTEHLGNIRGLIKDLEECPGRNDFQLEVPDWTPKAHTPSLVAQPNATLRKKRPTAEWPR